MYMSELSRAKPDGLLSSQKNLSSYFNGKFLIFYTLIVYIKVGFQLDFRNHCFSLVKIITS